MENKYSFQGIDNEIRDSYLRTSQVFDERNKLRDNWNSLRECIEKRREHYRYFKDNRYRKFLSELLDKMNELESGEK